MEQTKVSLEFYSAFSVAMLMSASFFISGCVGLERSNDSGYAYRKNENAQVSIESDRRQFQREAARMELGEISSERALSDRQVLLRHEKQLEGKGEREQYYKAKPYLKNDSERVALLRLNSTTARDRYLSTKGIDGDQITHPPEIQALIEQNDIGAGMTRQAVKEAWGAPDDVEIAGNPMYGNEKWKYSEQVTSSDGYMTEKRTVVFESGLVVGWETR